MELEKKSKDDDEAQQQQRASESEEAADVEEEEDDDDEGRNEEPSSAFREIRAAFVANSSAIHLGLMFSFSAMALPEMMAPDSAIQITTEQASWIASIASFATPAGCLFGAYVMDQRGRKFALVLLAVPCVLGWLSVGTAGLIATHVSNAATLNIIYCGRMLQGFGTGIVAGSARIYTSEISTPRLRGTLTALASLNISVGVLVGYSLGAMFYWPVVAILSALIPLTSVTLTLIYLPETPTWYLTRKRNYEALEALKRVRDPKRSDFAVKRELDHLGGVLDSSPDWNKWRELSKASSLKPLALVTFYFFTYQFSGIGVMTFYNVQIVEATGAPVNANHTAVVFGIIRLVFNIVGCYLLTVCNRRTLTLASGVSSGFCMLSLATHNYWMRTGAAAHLEDSWLWHHLPIGIIVLFYICYSMGYLLIPWVLTGEIYPAKIRGLLGGITVCFAHSLLFVTIKSFPFMIGELNFHGTFWLYGSTVTVGSIALFIMLPETRNKTLHEIESRFKRRAIIRESFKGSFMKC